MMFRVWRGTSASAKEANELVVKLKAGLKDLGEENVRLIKRCERDIPAEIAPGTQPWAIYGHIDSDDLQRTANHILHYLAESRLVGSNQAEAVVKKIVTQYGDHKCWLGLNCQALLSGMNPWSIDRMGVEDKYPSVLSSWYHFYFKLKPAAAWYSGDRDVRLVYFGGWSLGIVSMGAAAAGSVYS